MLNQRALAEQLGLSQTTVSRALRSHPSIPQETRERVWNGARAHGYRPNPQVAALMEQIRRGRTPEAHSTIAILAHGDLHRAPHNTTSKQQYDGMVDEAHRHGYRTELFPIPQDAHQSKEMDRILYSRGIMGVILAYSKSFPYKQPLTLNWDRYTTGTVSYIWSHLSIDRASTNHHQNTVYAFNELLHRGYHRIAIALPANAMVMKKGAYNPWLSAYLACAYNQPQSQQIPIFVGTVHDTDAQSFKTWYERWKPDALLCLLGEEIQWLKQVDLSPGEDLGLVCLNRPLDSTLTGIEENNFQVGRMVSDLVISRLTHNQLGLPQCPRLVLIDGIWKEGETLSKTKPKGKKKSAPTGRSQ